MGPNLRIHSPKAAPEGVRGRRGALGGGGDDHTGRVLERNETRLTFALLRDITTFTDSFVLVSSRNHENVFENSREPVTS
ncbi:hypothetical protein E2C01_004697 [Portunus trituberculatus]|uniref:Uncharacterized protein n=1 Tax=Portunus trituberculatus TaxID=210409 RepID=A0A5B7CRE5_PORTR|nr:hypothetical protein [Portunus trituberculatus]